MQKQKDTMLAEGHVIKALRFEKCFRTQQSVCDAVEDREGIIWDRAELSRLETGDMPLTEFLRNRICRVFDISPDNFEERVTKHLANTRERVGAKPVLAIPDKPQGIKGRDDDIDRIRALVTGDRPFMKVAVRGLAGVGKSTVAALLAHDPELAIDFPHGVLWAGLGPEPQVEGALRSWIRAAHLPEPPASSRRDDMSAELRTEFLGKRILFLVDDVWSSEHLQHLLVGDARSSRLVFTTRAVGVAREVVKPDYAIYHLDRLSPSDCLELLNDAAPTVVEHHGEGCARLTEALEGLPMAIVVAGTLLAKEASLQAGGVEELLLELEMTGRIIAEKRPPLMMDLVSATSPGGRPTIAALLMRSVQYLDKETQEKFAFLGPVAERPATFGLAFLRNQWNPTLFEEGSTGRLWNPDPMPTVRTLVDRGLLEPVGGARYQMHSLYVMLAKALLKGGLVGVAHAT